MRSRVNLPYNPSFQRISSMIKISLILILLTFEISGQQFSQKHKANPTKSTEDILTKQTYYLSEQEYKLIDLDDLLLDYKYTSNQSDCNSDIVTIEEGKDEKYVTYTEDSIKSSVNNIITFVNKNTLKVNGVGLLSNASLITFIDDASAYDTQSSKTSTHLKNMKSFPIPNQDQCMNLKKTGYNSFLFECSKNDPSTNQTIITLYQYKSADLSNPDGIDLQNAQILQTQLDFDPKFAYTTNPQNKNPKENSEQGIADSNQDYQQFLQQYYSCVRDTGYYFNENTHVYNYFRACKYHETLMQSNNKEGERRYIEDVASFFEFYDLNQTQGGLLKGTSPIAYFAQEDDYKIKVQGVQQIIDVSISVLDFDNGLLFFNYDIQTGQYKNQDYFIKYFYDQKYFNLFIQENQDIEYTIQDSIPNYLVVNTQMYLIMYQQNAASDVGINTFPQTVSISHFIQSVQDIHDQNKHNEGNNNNNNNNNNQNVNSQKIPDIKDITSFRSIKYNFDQYLYYIQIQFNDNNNNSSYFLLINRALTDYTNSMKMNSTAIEMDYQTNSEYAKIFHYPIPGLFYSNIRTRVRLLELGDIEDAKKPGFKSQADNGKKLQITTYSWKSSQVMKLYTKQFDVISSCNIQMLFTPRQRSIAVGTKEITAQINLIPRNFQGVISKYGADVSQKFFNPKPVFEIKDWFFGPGINYDYQTKGPNNNVSMTISYNSSTLIDGDCNLLLFFFFNFQLQPLLFKTQGNYFKIFLFINFPTSSQLNFTINNFKKATIVMKENKILYDQEVKVKDDSTEFGTCKKVHICDERLVAAIQVGNDYYIFYQSCICLLWFEKCTLNKTVPGKTMGPTITQSCKKSLNITLTMNVDQILFDGQNIIAASYTKINNLSGEKSNKNVPLQLMLIQVNVIQEVQKPQVGTQPPPQFPSQNLKDIPKINPQQLPISPNSNSYNAFSDQDQNQCQDIPPTNLLYSQNSIQGKSKQKIIIKKNHQEKIQKKNENTAKRTSAVTITKYILNTPKKILLTEQIENVSSLSIFCIPNTLKYGAVFQTNVLGKTKYMSIFTIQKSEIVDYTSYKFLDSSNFQDSYDVSLLDQGIIFASSNKLSDAVPGLITIYKVNFIAKEIYVDRLFTQADMVNQIQKIQNQSINNDKSKQNDAITSEQQENIDQNSQEEIQLKQLKIQQKIDEMKLKNLVFINDPSNFMNNFSVKVWRNDDTQTYRFLLIDYDNNCLFDYYLYDLIKPIFIRQVNLYDFQISPSQQFQITNNMMSLHVTKGTATYLISLEINGDSINQIRKIQQQEDKQSYSQVQQALGTPYTDGTICGVFSLPNPVINCIFNPSILLDFDYSQNTTPTPQQLQSIDPESGSSDKEVDFQIQIFSDLDKILQTKEAKQNVILHTDFSNFDTNLIQDSSQPTKYVLKNATMLSDEKQQFAQFSVNTKFVKGSIENYYIQQSDNKQHQIRLSEYIDTKYNKNITLIHNLGQYHSIDRNPYQLVNLMSDSIVVINQNIKFNFEIIYQIKYTDIKIRSPYQGYSNENNSKSQKGKDLPQNLKVCFCTQIFSNDILRSQTTTTYLYILLCNVDLTKQAFITFNVDVNHFSSLDDQKQDWDKAMKNNVRQVDIIFAEEDLNSMIDSIKAISIISLLDDSNNIAGYIFMMVRELTDSENPNAQPDNTIYVLWAEKEQDVQALIMYEIEQINSADFSLNYITVINFQASFPYAYPNQTRLNLDKKQDFVFNIGWDDKERYVILALLKLTLPPNLDDYENDNDTSNTKNQKLVFETQFVDIYDKQFSSFIKVSETYYSPFTALKSTITFQQDTYNASVIITNEFSIIEFSANLSPSPYILTDPKNINKYQSLKDNSNQDKIGSVIIYTQYALCNNKFNVDNTQQEILKYDKFLIIRCRLPQTPQSEKANVFLKVYKINSDDDDDDNKEDGDIEQNIYSNFPKRKLQNKKIKNKTNPYSMVQSISLESDLQTSVSSMSFRQDNQALYLDLILSNLGNFTLYQYPVNNSTMLLVNPRINDNQEVSICTNNTYNQQVCNTAIFVNPFVDIDDQSKKQWLKFSGLVALPLFISLSLIFVSFVLMKKFRKNRQDEFIELLKNQSMAQYKSKSDISFMEPLNVNNETKNDYKYSSTGIFQHDHEKNQQISVSDHALFTFNDHHLIASTELR